MSPITVATWRHVLRAQVAVGYLRRSTNRQEQSIPDPRKAIERYAAEHGLELTRFFIDDAISGTSAVRRPAFQEMVGHRSTDPLTMWSVPTPYVIGRGKGGVEKSTLAQLEGQESPYKGLRQRLGPR
jgi:hypothetical protein